VHLCFGELYDLVQDPVVFHGGIFQSDGLMVAVFDVAATAANRRVAIVAVESQPLAGMTGTVENVWMIDVAAAVFGHVFFVVESQLVEQRVRLECANPLRWKNELLTTYGTD